MLTVEGLTIRYDGIEAVRNLDFKVQEGEAVGLVGESGSGKTQTALALLGLLPPNAETEGSVLLGEQQLLGAGEGALRRVRANRIAMVFQDPMQALNPFVTIGAQLSRALRANSDDDATQAKKRVIEMLERVGLPDAARQFHRYPHELSGGMRQRVMIGSALITKPDLLVADEPTTALDVTVQAQILQLLADIRENTALLLITHDLGVVANHSDRMVVLQNGALVEEGTTLEVFASPRHAHTRTLLALAPRLDRADPPATQKGETVFEVESADVIYGRGKDALTAVRGVGFSVRAGETLAIVGESGSGKSSAVRAALGLVPMRSGRVVYAGEPLQGLAEARKAAAQRGLQLVFQDAVSSLNPQFRVADIVAEPIHVHEPRSANASARASAMLEKCGLGEEFLRRYPHELSGGQAQRVAIARALVLEPDVLVCDEAVAALDGTVREQILALLRELQAETGLGIIFITHDLSVVRAISHRVLVMYLGSAVELADNQALFDKPRHPYTRALLDAVPHPDPRARLAADVISGEAPSPLDPPAGCAFHPRCRYAKEVCRVDTPASTALGGALVSCHLAAELALERR